jgi:hypothetical protein
MVEQTFQRLDATRARLARSCELLEWTQDAMQRSEARTLVSAVTLDVVNPRPHLLSTEQ